MNRTKTTPALTDDQRKVLEIRRDHPDANLKDIVGMLDDVALDYEYVEGVVNNFHLPEEEEQVWKRNGATAGDTTQTVDVDDEDEDEPDDGGEDDGFTPAKRVRRVDTIGGKSREVIEYIRENPDHSNKTVEKNVSGTMSTVKRAVRNYCHLLPEDANVFNTFGHPEDDDLDDLSHKKEKIVRYLRDNPTAKGETVAEKVDVTPSHVTNTVQEYAHLIPAEAANNFPGVKRDPRLEQVGQGTVEKSDEEPDEGDGGKEDSTFWESEGQRLEFLHRVGSIDDDEYEQKLAELEEEPDDTDTNVEADEDGRPVIDATEQYITERPEIEDEETGLDPDVVEAALDEYRDEDGGETHPDIKGYGNVVNVVGDEEGAGISEDFLERLEDKEKRFDTHTKKEDTGEETLGDRVAVDKEAAKAVKNEFEWHRENHDELTEFALGMKRVIDRLGL